MSGRGCLALALTVAAAAALTAQSRDPTFSVKVEAVRVDVLVTEGNNVVRGLTASDFEIRDNGLLQQVDLVSFDQIPLNVVLALDMSESVAGARLAQLQSASGALLSALKPGDQSALVTFSQQVRLAAPLSTNLSFVRLALDTASSAGGTALADAVYAAMVVGESEAGRALLIVFSDGVDTASWLTDERMTEMAKRSNAVIYAVCAPSITRPELLGELTSLTGGRLREIEKTQNLPQVFLSILEEFRARYLVSYTPRGVSKNGWHRLDVRVKARRATVKARPGYLGGF